MNLYSDCSVFHAFFHEQLFFRSLIDWYQIAQNVIIMFTYLKVEMLFMQTHSS